MSRLTNLAAPSLHEIAARRSQPPSNVMTSHKHWDKQYSLCTAQRNEHNRKELLGQVCRQNVKTSDLGKLAVSVTSKSRPVQPGGWSHPAPDGMEPTWNLMLRARVLMPWEMNLLHFWLWLTCAGWCPPASKPSCATCRKMLSATVAFLRKNPKPCCKQRHLHAPAAQIRTKIVSLMECVARVAAKEVGNSRQWSPIRGAKLLQSMRTFRTHQTILPTLALRISASKFSAASQCAAPQEKASAV